MSLMVTLSDNCAGVTHGIIAIVRHNSSTRCQYNPGVDNNCAMQIRNTLLVQCAITPCSALTVTNNRPLIDDRLIPYQALRIPGHVAASLGYLHNHLAHPSGGSVVWGVFIPTGVFGSLCLVSGLTSAGMVRGWLVEIGTSHQIRWNILREHNWGVPSAHNLLLDCSFLCLCTFLLPYSSFSILNSFLPSF